MVAKEPYQDPVEENTDLQESYEAEETLSLCDLPIYSDPSDRDDHSKDRDQSLPQDDDFFEFLSEDFTASTCAATANKNIIFCGKLIPYKELPGTENTRNHESTGTKDFTRRKTFFDGNHSVDFNKKKSTSKYSKLQSDKDSNTLSLASPKSHVYETRKCDFAVGKVSLMASPAKSRWYLFILGMARFPTVMELRDIRTRQSRMSSQSSMFRSADFDGTVKANANGERRGVKGLWRRLRRTMGLGSKQCGTRKSNFGIKL
ncbi:hypothetical protein I3843_01G267700 [Carya illinoinensis]|nr:hypothetical protein I3843_01G267700 [Carya illinoinensis]